MAEQVWGERRFVDVESVVCHPDEYSDEEGVFQCYLLEREYDEFTGEVGLEREFELNGVRVDMPDDVHAEEDRNGNVRYFLGGGECYLSGQSMYEGNVSHLECLPEGESY